MDKLLVDRMGNYTLFDVDKNAVKVIPEAVIGTAFVADEDGQAISSDEVLDYKKGDVILTLRTFINQQWYTKIVRCEDVFAKYDVAGWYNNLPRA